MDTFLSQAAHPHHPRRVSPAPAQARLAPAIAARTRVILPLILALLSFWPASVALSQERFPKDAQVRLIRDTPLLFQSKEVRTGKAGEVFPVHQHNAATKRVFVLSTGADGKPAALNIPEDALEVLGPDLPILASRIEELCAKKDFAGAAKAAEGALKIAPASEGLQKLGEAVAALAAAENRVAKARQAEGEAAKRIALLQRNAQVAAQPNRLRPSDQSGFSRAQAMAQEAEQLSQATAKEKEEAAAGQASATEALQGLLASLKAPAAGSRAGAASPAAAAGKPPVNAGAKDPIAALLAAYAPGKPSTRFEHDAIQISRLEEGRYYFIGGGAGQPFLVQQVGEDFIFAAEVTEKPWAMLGFENPKAIAGVQIREGWVAEAVGRFAGFKTIPLNNGATQRCPLFICVGLNIIGGDFVDTSAPREALPSEEGTTPGKQ